MTTHLNAITIAAAGVVTEGALLAPGWFTLAHGVVVEVGAGAPPQPAGLDFGAATIIPGFVDIHVHGGGGYSFADADPDSVRAAIAFHRAHGTTTMVASLVSAAPNELLDQVNRLRPLVESGELAGIHLEGPWLSHHRCGAHDPDALRAPDTAEVDRLIAAGGGTIRMVTIAPELDGAIEAIATFADANIAVAIGHTDATWEQTHDAIDHGARMGTHLFNAMRPLHHREPGPVPALLADDRVIVELIDDGLHLHAATVSYVQRIAGPRRVALVSDAISAAGMPDGSYRLGEVDVEVAESIARVRGTEAIAGSTTTLGQMFTRVATRRTDTATTDLARLLAAVDMTSRTPARALGLDTMGDLRSGGDADFVVIDADMRVQHVFTNGVEVRPEV